MIGWAIASDGNERAQRFYGKNRFERDGHEPALPFAGQALRTVRMVQR